MKASLDLRRRLRAACVIAATAWLCACGGSSSEETPPAAVPLGDPVSRTIGAAGGTVEATSLGVRARLTFPADALAKDTLVSVTPLRPAAGDAVSLMLKPSGVFFAKTVTVVLEYPAGTVPDKTAMLRQSLGGQDAFVVTSVDTKARTVSGQLTTFGGATLTTLAAEGRKTTQRATVQADPPADDGGTLTASQLTSIDALIQSGQRRLDALLANERFGPAYALQVSLAALIQRSGEDGYTARAEPFLRAAHDSACAARARAIATSQAATITQFGQFKSLIEPILYWDAAAQRLGSGPCSGVSADSAAHDVIAKELAFAKVKMEQGRTPGDVVRPSNEVKDAREVISILRQLQRTDPSAPSIQHADPRHHAAGLRAGPMSLNLSTFAVDLQSEFIDPMLDPARRTGWTVARDTGVLSQYETLFDAFGPTAVLQQDVQFARTRIGVASTDSSAQPIASATLGFAAVPDLPAAPVRAATVQVSKGGALQLSGSIAQLECTTAVNEALKVSFEGVEVASINGSAGMLASGAVATFTPEALLAAARLPSDDQGVHPLVVRRTGSACAAAFGITDDVLATVALDFGGRPMQVKVTRAELIHASADSRALELREPQYGFTRSAPVPVLPAPVPFSMSTNDCCAPHSAAMSLRLRDANTIDFSDEFSNLQFPNGVYVRQRDGVDFRVTFARSGTVTMRLNPAWFVNGSECYYRAATNELRVNSNMHWVFGAAGEINASNYDAPSNSYLFDQSKTVGYSPCDADSKALWLDTLWTRSTAEFQVVAGSEWQFRVAATHEGQGVMVGSGTAMTIHFEPTP